MSDVQKIAKRFQFKLAQHTKEDIKTLQGVKTNLFGPISWNYINQFMNELNSGLFELAGTQKIGNQAINFQSVVKNPTGATRFVGGLKSLFQLSMALWNIVSATKEEPYSINEARELAEQLLNTLNTSNFPEPQAQSIKPKLTSILNNWIGVLR